MPRRRRRWLLARRRQPAPDAKASITTQAEGIWGRQAVRAAESFVWFGISARKGWGRHFDESIEIDGRRLATLHASEFITNLPEAEQLRSCTLAYARPNSAAASG